MFEYTVSSVQGSSKGETESHFDHNVISRLHVWGHEWQCPPSSYRGRQSFPTVAILWILSGGGWKRLLKFKFSAKFPIGLHVILQIQIKNFENDCYIMWKIISTENPSRFNVEPLLK